MRSDTSQQKTLSRWERGGVRVFGFRPKIKKPRLLSAASGKGRTSEVYPEMVAHHSQLANRNPAGISVSAEDVNL